MAFASCYTGATSGFPNLFMLYGPNTNNGSIIQQIEYQVDYVLRKIEAMQRDHIRWIDISPAAMDAWIRELDIALDAMPLWNTGTSSYYHAAGGRNVTQWPHSITRYRDETQRDDWDLYERA